MSKQDYLSRLWVPRTNSVNGWWKANTCWRVNKIWDDSILKASNPARYRANPPSSTEVDWRITIQNIHTGALVDLFVLTLEEYFEGFGQGDVLVPQWSDGVIQFDGPEALAGWKYDDQGIVHST